MIIKRYLFDPNKQFQDKSGKNNVNGLLRVFINNTDDRAVTYKDFDGTLNEADIRLDNNGRAIVIVDDSKTYRLEVYDSIGNMLWTAKPLYAIGANGGGVSPDDIKPLVLKQFGKNLGTYSPLNGNTITIGDSAVHVAVDHANIHAYLTEILADGRTPVLVMSDTDPDTPGVTRDFYFYPTARTGVDSDYSFIGYDGEVVNVATVHDDDTVTYATYGAQIPFDYTADVMYSPNIKVNSLGQTWLVQKGRPNRLIAEYFDTAPSNPGYIVNATEISNGYIEIEIPLPSFTLDGVTVTPNFLFAYNYKYLTSIKGLNTDEDGLAEFKKIEVILRRESDHTQDYIIAVATDFSKDEYGRKLSDVAGLQQGSESRYIRTYPKDTISYLIRFTKILVRYHFDLDFNEGVMANLQPGDSVGNLPEVRVVMDPLRNTSYQQEIGNV